MLTKNYLIESNDVMQCLYTLFVIPHANNVVIDRKANKERRTNSK